jgi:hypothetical protein
MKGLKVALNRSAFGGTGRRIGEPMISKREMSVHYCNIFGILNPDLPKELLEHSARGALIISELDYRNGRVGRTHSASFS